MERGLLLPDRPYTSLDEYVAAGGGDRPACGARRWR